MERVSLKESNTNKTGTEYIGENYGELLRYSRKCLGRNGKNNMDFIHDIYLKVADLEENGEWKGTTQTAENCVHGLIKYTAMSYKYTTGICVDYTDMMSNDIDDYEDKLYSDKEDTEDIIETDSIIEVLNYLISRQDEYNIKLILESFYNTEELVEVHKTLYNSLNEEEREMLYSLLVYKRKYIKTEKVFMNDLPQYNR